MVALQEFEEYFTSLATKIGAKKVLFYTSEGEVKDVITEISPDDQPVMMVIIPSAKTNGSSQDNVKDVNSTLIYLLNREERTEKTTFIIQKELQPQFEQMKRQMIADKDKCGIMSDLDVSSFHSDPESKLYTSLTGWSLSFNFDTDL